MIKYLPLVVIGGYLLLLLVLGLISSRFFRGTSRDYFVASQSIGPFMLLMSVFGTTMTAFALVGSTGESFRNGIGTYGKMASWSGLIHSACFFLVGIKLWAFGKRYGYVTQCQFFRDRFESRAVGHVLFPALVLLVIPYLLIGLLGAVGVMKGLTVGMFPNAFSTTGGALPPWLTGLLISGVVLTYVFLGGVRGAVWANTFQTLVFVIMGVVAFFAISNALGGPAKATQMVVDSVTHAPKLSREQIPPLQFLTYAFVPLSVGMFPHLFQHWLTAKSAKTFRLTVIAHPLFIMIVWVPCVLLGLWATSAIVDGQLVVPAGARGNTQLALMVKNLTSPALAGLLTAGILAAIMSSLDSQFMCLGTMFTNDIVADTFGRERFSDKQMVLLARGFIVAIVLVTYLLCLWVPGKAIFPLAVWCFSGFGALFPIVVAALYWKRTTKAGVIAAVLATAAVWVYAFTVLRTPKNPYGLVADMMPATFMFAACAAALVIVSLITRPPSQATVAKFFPRQLEG